MRVSAMRDECLRVGCKLLPASVKGDFITAVSPGVSGIAAVLLTAQVARNSKAWILWANSPSSSSRTSPASQLFPRIFCLFEVDIMGDEQPRNEFEVEAVARSLMTAVTAARAASSIMAPRPIEATEDGR